MYLSHKNVEGSRYVAIEIFITLGYNPSVLLFQNYVFAVVFFYF